MTRRRGHHRRFTKWTPPCPSTRRREAHRRPQCGPLFLCAESNEGGPKANRGGIPTAGARYVPPHLATHPAPLTTSTQHVNDEGEWTPPHRQARPPTMKTNQTATPATTTTTNMNTDEEHEQHAPSTDDKHEHENTGTHW